ncbi:MAG: protein-L-isoaspartate O-methyltransferase [Xanthobacteraceae bacterium]|nr:protein-L-isoaspartate O-methyltransferase [Xanthobacteraceae bacterium]
MFDFAAARRMMVDGQVRTADVTDQRIIGAMQELPRERFVPARNASLAYLDLDVAVTEGTPPRRLLKPMVLAKLVQAAEVGPQDRVLDLACATGYSSALLAKLAGTVTALEEDATLARHARENLAAVGAGNAQVVSGPLAGGWPAGAPYDVILVNGAAEVVPERLLRQLAEGGRLVAVVGRRPASKAVLHLASAGQASALPIFDAAAPALPGFAEPPQFVF